jgi:hypothetical protein
LVAVGYRSHACLPADLRGEIGWHVVSPAEQMDVYVLVGS